MIKSLPFSSISPIMHLDLALRCILVLGYLTITSLASPYNLPYGDLEPRRMPIGNRQNLKCGNAPTVVAGRYVKLDLVLNC